MYVILHANLTEPASHMYYYVCMYVLLLVRNYVQLSGFGNWALQKSGFPLCELLIKLATFLPGATRGPFGGLFSGIGALQKSGFPNM